MYEALLAVMQRVQPVHLGFGKSAGRPCREKFPHAASVPRSSDSQLLRIASVALPMQSKFQSRPVHRRLFQTRVMKMERMYWRIAADRFLQGIVKRGKDPASICLRRGRISIAALMTDELIGVQSLPIEFVSWVEIIGTRCFTGRFPL